MVSLFSKSCEIIGRRKSKNVAPVFASPGDEDDDDDHSNDAGKRFQTERTRRRPSQQLSIKGVVVSNDDMLPDRFDSSEDESQTAADVLQIASPSQSLPVEFRRSPTAAKTIAKLVFLLATHLRLQLN